MKHTYHRLSRDAFATLASGGGSDAIGELTAAEYSKHVTLLHGVLAAAEGTEQYAIARAGYDLLAAALRENSAAAEKVIAYPTVGTWARRTILARRGAQTLAGAEPEMLCAVGAAAAIRAGLSAQIEVSAVDGQVTLPGLGAARVPDSEARASGHRVLVRIGRAGATVGAVQVPEDPYRDAPGWLGLRQVRAGSLDVLIDDLDPFRMPDLTDLAPRQDTEPWDAALQAAWQVLEQHHPAVAAEAAAAVAALVPRSRPSSGEVSTSSPEAFGAIALSLPPDPVTFAVTITHELQHLKLGALLDVVTLALPDDRTYYAPWRDDPRPLYGLLQGAYAYLGVSGFWRRQRELPGDDHLADVEYARWRVAAANTVETIRSSGRLTSAGLEFTDAMARTLNAWCDEPLPDRAESMARHNADAHRDRWQSAHGPIPVYRLEGRRVKVEVETEALGSVLGVRVFVPQGRVEPVHGVGVQFVGLRVRAGRAQVQNEVRRAAQGERMVQAHQLAEPPQRALAERAGVGDLPEHRKVAGQVHGHHQRVVMVAGEPGFKALERLLVQAARLFWFPGVPAQQGQVPDAAVVVRMLVTVNARILLDGPLRQLDRLVEQVVRPPGVGQADGRGHRVRVVVAEARPALLVDLLRYLCGLFAERGESTQRDRKPVGGPQGREVVVAEPFLAIVPGVLPHVARLAVQPLDPDRPGHDVPGDEHLGRRYARGRLAHPDVGLLAVFPGALVVAGQPVVESDIGDGAQRLRGSRPEGFFVRSKRLRVEGERCLEVPSCPLVGCERTLHR